MKFRHVFFALMLLSWLVALLVAVASAQGQEDPAEPVMSCADRDRFNNISDEFAAGERDITFYAVFLHRERVRYEDMRVPDCAERLHTISIQQIAGHQDIIAVASAFIASGFDVPDIYITDIQDRLERLRSAASAQEAILQTYLNVNQQD